MPTTEAQFLLTCIVILFFKPQVMLSQTIEMCKTICFADGNVVPNVGYAASKKKREETLSAVALDMGYKMIEASKFLDNEKIVGNAMRRVIQKGTITREDIVVITKLGNTQHRPEVIGPAINRSLELLGLKYVDICMLATPLAWMPSDEISQKERKEDFQVSLEETYAAMEDLVTKKIVRRLGLANFNITQIKRILKVAKIKPQVIEYEVHPYYYPRELIDFCHQENMVVFSSKPLGGIPVNATFWNYNPIKDRVIERLSYKYHKSASQIVLRFLHQNKIIPIVKTWSTVQLVKYNNFFDFEITEPDMALIASINKNLRTLFFTDKKHREYPFKGKKRIPRIISKSGNIIFEQNYTKEFSSRPKKIDTN